MTERIEVQCASRLPVLPTNRVVRDWVQAVLYDQSQQASLVVRFVDEEEGRTLNAKFRHHDTATNVLSFPYEALPGIKTDALGDIVICTPVVLREAKAQGKAAEAHFAHLVVHGILHLLGYDHLDQPSALRMETCETRILAQLGFPAPYEQPSSVTDCA